MGQGLGASHRGLVTSDTDQWGPGVASQGEGHGATATRGAQNSPPVSRNAPYLVGLGICLSNNDSFKVILATYLQTATYTKLFVYSHLGYLLTGSW